MLARFAAARRGATAVEFAMVAIPFLFMIFAIFEMTVIFLLNATLESAVTHAARQIRTGQTLNVDGISDTTSVNQFRQTICNNMFWMQTQCLAGVAAASSSGATTDSLVVDIRDPASFGSLTEPSPTNGSNQLLQYDGTKTYCAGAAGSVVVVRAFYPWKTITPFLRGAFTYDANGNMVLSAAAVFKNEPYSTSPSPC